MALFNSFKFGDVDSKDYGVYISGDSVYDSPARSVDLVQVPGRNGALALDNGYYENIEVTYPAGSFGTSQEEWREKMLGIRNALAAQRGYQKLIDTYHPEHYRLGMFFAGISASPVQYNRAGQFPIRFNCKPQRFLISGDEAVEFTAEGQEEVYGPASIASFEAEEGAEIRQLEVDLEPVQDLNGYDNPWPAGGGKNILPHSGSTTTTNGITFTMNEDGTVTASGTATAQAIFTYNNSDFITPPTAGTYYFNGNPTGASSTTYRMRTRRYVNGSWASWVYYNDTSNQTLTVVDGTTKMQVEIHFMSGQTVSGLVFKPMLRSTSYTDSTYAPYSNICPISGHTEANVYRTGKNLLGGRQLADDIVSAVNVPSNTYIGENADGKYVTFAANSFISNKVFTSKVKFKENTQYTFILRATRYQSGNLASNIQVRYTDGTLDALSLNAASASDIVTRTFTSLSGKTVQDFSLFWGGSRTYLFYEDSGIFEGSIPIDAYEPYNGNTYNVPFGQTVYGGALNVTTGVLTVDRAMVTLNGSENWTKSSSALNGFYMICPQMKPYSRLISDKFIYTASASQYFNNYGYCYTDSTIAVSIDPAIAGNTVDSFKAWLAANPTQFVYYIKTPTAYQLTPAQVSTLLGANNIWSDAGEVEVKVAAPVDLTNPTNFPAKPLIRIYGNGSARVGDTIATVQNNADGYVDIDCESMNCYDTTGGRNADVSFSGNDFPELASGDNGILLTGPSKVEITPRWWEL